MCRYKLHVFDTKRGDKEKKFLWISKFLDPIFPDFKICVISRFFLKELLKGCMQKHLLYTKICAIDLPYIEGKLIEK